MTSEKSMLLGTNWWLRDRNDTLAKGTSSLLSSILFIYFEGFITIGAVHLDHRSSPEQGGNVNLIVEFISILIKQNPIQPSIADELE